MDSLTYLWVALAASGATLAATLIVINLLGGEKRIETTLPLLYETDDAEFRRALGSLLARAAAGGRGHGPDVQQLAFGWQREHAPHVPAGAHRSARMHRVVCLVLRARFVHHQNLRAAAERGVRNRILLPGAHIDKAVARRASRASWGPLLEAGVEIAEYQPTMFHMKALVVDDRFVSVGSTNFDNRSFLLNDEANLNVISQPLAARLHALFEDDWAHGKPLSFEAWRRRPWREKLVEQGARLLRSQL